MSYMVQTIIFEISEHVWKQPLETIIHGLQIETWFQWTDFMTIMINSISYKQLDLV